MITRSFLVSGLDETDDRGVLEFDCDEADDAAREYLRAYVEDWRGDNFPEEKKLSIRVWRADQVENEAIAFAGRIEAARVQSGDLDFQYHVEEDLNAEN